MSTNFRHRWQYQTENNVTSGLFLKKKKTLIKSSVKILRNKNDWKNKWIRTDCLSVLNSWEQDQGDISDIGSSQINWRCKHFPDFWKAEYQRHDSSTVARIRIFVVQLVASFLFMETCLTKTKTPRASCPSSLPLVIQACNRELLSWKVHEYFFVWSLPNVCSLRLLSRKSIINTSEEYLPQSRISSQMYHKTEESSYFCFQLFIKCTVWKLIHDFFSKQKI